MLKTNPSPFFRNLPYFGQFPICGQRDNSRGFHVHEYRVVIPRFLANFLQNLMVSWIELTQYVIFLEIIEFIPKTFRNHFHPYWVVIQNYENQSIPLKLWENYEETNMYSMHILKKTNFCQRNRFIRTIFYEKQIFIEYGHAIHWFLRNFSSRI